jgi:uncharacterized protein (DUF849 family)
MSGPRKIIISCAITGSIHTPTMSDALPVTATDIAGQAVAAAEAGAAILHLHARDPKNGRPTADPEAFLAFLPRIRQATGAVVNITTGGGQGMTIEQRLAAPARLKPEMCSLNMGSMNFGLYPMLARHKSWKHEWEPAFLEASRQNIFRNTFLDIESILAEMSGKHGARFEFECYDIGHLYTLAHFLERGLVAAPLFVQFILGILGGIGSDPANLVYMKETADKLFGDAYEFSVLGAGRHQMALGVMGAVMGGHVRVGLEDNLYIGRGKLAQDNAEQVAKMKRILTELSLDTATPDEARELLNLKGPRNVGF